jgi:opacity protein-like surface antigen
MRRLHAAALDRSCAGAVLVVALGAAMVPDPAFAQQRRQRDRRIEVGVGPHVVGSIRYDDVNAAEVGFGGVAKTVFSTRTTFGPIVGPEGRLGVRLTRHVGLEAAFVLGSGSLATEVSGDAEHTGAARADERITEYRWSGGVIVRRAVRPGRRMVPFASGGAGLVRYLHDGRMLAQMGQVYYGGGGVEYLLGAPSRTSPPSSGLRVEVRVTIPRSGVALDQSVHVAPAFGASVFARF